MRCQGTTSEIFMFTTWCEMPWLLKQKKIQKNTQRMKQGVAKHSSEWSIVGKWVLCFWHDEWMWTCFSLCASVCMVSLLGGIGAQWIPTLAPSICFKGWKHIENERWKQYKHSQYFSEHFPAQGYARADQRFKTEYNCGKMEEAAILFCCIPTY